MTKQQTLILEIIKETEEHLSADQIFLIARKSLPTIAMGTVYRNLNVLVAEGKIKRVIIPGQPDRFDRRLSEHEHLLCDSCKSIKDIKIDGLKEFLEAKVASEIGAIDLCIHYICDQCKK